MFYDNQDKGKTNKMGFVSNPRVQETKTSIKMMLKQDMTNSRASGIT
jgi:hypothetical protein